MSSRTRRESSGFSIGSGSEIYRSARSEFSDQQLSVNRSAAIVVPSPSHQRSLELVGLLGSLNFATSTLLLSNSFSFAASESVFHFL